MVSENTIYFYPGQGGHSHDGGNSSFIDTSKYSLFDFSWGFLGDPSRIADQTRNYVSFENFIIETVNNAVLKPASIILQPGTVNGSAHIVSRSIDTGLITANAITANEILAGTITADELAANIVLVNNIISSSNYSPGVSGWAINGNGNAEFANTSIRGTIQADSLTTPGIDIDSAGNLNANNFNLYANGAIYASGGNFQVSAGGILSATGASITGTIEASSLVTPGIDIDSAGNLTANNFSLYANGFMYASGGNFQVSAAGNLYAENADITGEINATLGSIAGWLIGADTISAAGGEISLYQEPGYGAVIAGSSAGTQIILNSEAQLHAEFSGVTTDINFQTDTAYVFRITDGNQFIKISPLLVSAQVGASYSFLANDMIATTGEVSMNTASVNGIGIMYPGCTTGPGAFNYMGLVWDNPNIRGTVDNAVSAVLGTVSDIRSKVNIIDAPNEWALKTLNNLRVVEYNPINILNPDDKTEKPKRLGLIAQELADVFPELVTSVNADDPDAILSVDYLGLVPHLIQVIKLLNDKIESIEQRIGE